MSERIASPVEAAPVPLHDGMTASWPALGDHSSAQVTESFFQGSTSSPHDALRQTHGKQPADAPSPLFPQLPGLNVVGFIDSGGMGHVYRAEQATPRRTVAVKIATSFNRAGMVSRERFDREIQALAAIAHPNIMPIYVAGDWHGFPYYAMRYMAGGPLSKHLPRFVGNPRAGVELLRKVVSGLRALHEAGIIHRDLKPHNILLDEHDEPLIADMGLAKWVDGPNSELTVTSSALGTKYYMPPEQTAGSKAEVISPGCDIWSFGIMLFEILTGTRPFNDEPGRPIAEQILKVEAIIPASVPEGLANIIHRCLQKRPEDRYASAKELGEDLDRWLGGGTITPMTATKPKRLRRAGQLVALGLSLAIAVGIAAATAAVWPAKKKSIAERIQNREDVTIIGENGLPDDLGKPVLGSRATLNTDKNG